MLMPKEGLSALPSCVSSLETLARHILVPSMLQSGGQQADVGVGVAGPIWVDVGMVVAVAAGVADAARVGEAVSK